MQYGNSLFVCIFSYAGMSRIRFAGQGRVSAPISAGCAGPPKMTIYGCAYYTMTATAVHGINGHARMRGL